MDVVNYHQITVAGTFVENLTPRFYTLTLPAGIHTVRCAGDKAKAKEPGVTALYKDRDGNVSTKIYIYTFSPSFTYCNVVLQCINPRTVRHACNCR